MILPWHSHNCGCLSDQADQVSIVKWSECQLCFNGRLRKIPIVVS